MLLRASRRRKIPEREYRMLERRTRSVRLYLNPPLRNGAILLLIGLVSAAGGLAAWGLSGDPRALPESLVAVGLASAAGGVAAAWRGGRSMLPSHLMLALAGATVATALFAAAAPWGQRAAGLALGYVAFFPAAHVLSSLLEGGAPHRRAPRAGLPTLLGVAALFALRPDLAPLAPRVAAAAGVFTASALLLYWAADRRLFRRLGFRIPTVVRFYRDATTGSEPNIRPLVRGEEADLWVDVLAFRKAAGGFKALLVTTSVHPGFIRTLPGGDMPRRVARLLDDLGPTIVLKGPSTHEQDPLEDASEEIARGVREAVERLRFSAEVSDPARAVQGRAVVSARRVDSAVWSVETFAPHPTDDVDVRVHAELEAAAREMGLSLFFVDAHNCHGRDAAILPGTERARELVDAARIAFRASSAGTRSKLRLGLARRPFGSLLLFETVPGGRRDLLLALEENNMLPEAREKLREVLSVPGIVPGDAMEFCTSDTHQAIDPHHIHNPMGPEDVERRKGELKEMLYEAERNLEGVEVGYGRRAFRWQVFGTKIMEMKRFWEEEARRAPWFYGSWAAGTYAVAIALLAL